jgi:endonuclease/exonuclease/phosphatase family metal-dependent hydrolase
VFDSERPTRARAAGTAETEVPQRPLRVATYNIHKFVGNDGRRDPHRTLSVLREVDADILCIQEFDARKVRGCWFSVADLESELGATALVHPTRSGRRGYHGNLILTRFAARAVERHDIGRGADEFERRGMMVADFDIDGLPIRVANTHLALWPAARKRQAELLTRHLCAPSDGMLVLAGDLNEWLPMGCSHTHFHDAWGAHPNPPTFPAQRPVIGFDRIWVAPRRCLVRLEVHQSPLARMASDHLPVKATLDFAAAAAVRPHPVEAWGAAPALVPA